MFAIIYNGSADARDFLVQQLLFYTDQFMPKFSASKMKTQNITKVSAQKFYNAIFCTNCGIIMISLSLEYFWSNNHKIISR